MRVPEQPPWVYLCLIFVLWKATLFTIASLSPGIGYDTSTSLFHERVGADPSAGLLSRLQYHLIRWDALYFTSIARRDYFWEQEWAFGWGYDLRVLCQALLKQPLRHIPVSWVGIAVAHGCHLLSVLILFALCRLISGKSKIDAYALIPAALHIIAPAGIFLTAPYGEGPFSLLSFIGYWLFVFGLTGRTLRHDISIITSGLFFGAATSVRSNGLLNGSLFAIEILLLGPWGVLRNVRYTACLILAGLLNGAGTVLPQLRAYLTFCTGIPVGQERAPWCSALIPSVYSYVQRHYWNLGFLHYWELTNVPLFILAAPMFTIMFASAITALRAVWKARIHATHASDASRSPVSPVSPVSPGGMSPGGASSGGVVTTFQTSVLARLAVPQLLLATLALTSFHAQIITRIASGYVLPYLFITSLILGEEEGSHLRQRFHPKTIIRYMVMYAMIQGGLFASFLPPA